MRLDLLKKIAAMAYCEGNASEQGNATRKLEAMLAKDGYTLDDLSSLLHDKELMWVCFEFETEYEKKMIGQCVCHLMKTLKVHNKYHDHDVEFKLPVSRALEIRSFIDRVLKAYRKELENFQKAFLYKQRLFVEVENKQDKEELDNKNEKDNEKLSKEDLAAIRTMMGCIGRIQHRKMIEE